MKTIKKESKTFNIGEYCQGGVITIEIQGNSILVIGREWDFSKGSTKSSNQSNSKEFTRLVVAVDDGGAYTKLYNFLTELTSHYYTETIIDYIETKVKLGDTFTSW